MKTMLRWLLFRHVRKAAGLRRHVWKLLQHQRDLLKPEAVQSVETRLNDLRAAIRSGQGKAELHQAVESLENCANLHLRPYPHPFWRENLEVLLVAMAVALGVRTFFLQPFKIPTGSMQPTLFGIVSEPLAPDFKIPTGWERFRQGMAGVSYVHFVADRDGRLERLYPPVGIGKHGSLFRVYQKFVFAGQTHTLWFPPDSGTMNLAQRAGLHPDRIYRRGEDVFKLAVRSGDHLFVDRLTYNFRKPRRGEIIVFETRGITELPREQQDQFYIKRLVGLGGETLSIGNDRHLRVNGVRLDASTPHFEFVYSFDPRHPPADSQFSGHVNQTVYERHFQGGMVSPYFRDEKSTCRIPPNHLMVMGDNTLNSLDSRAWGAFSERKVIGKYCFVYWPLSDRFGWAPR